MEERAVSSRPPLVGTYERHKAPPGSAGRGLSAGSFGLRLGTNLTG